MDEYDKLEKEFKEKRLKRREEIAEFMDDHVLPKWTELTNQRHKIETRVAHSHEVGFIVLTKVCCTTVCMVACYSSSVLVLAKQEILSQDLKQS